MELALAGDVEHGRAEGCCDEGYGENGEQGGRNAASEISHGGECEEGDGEHEGVHRVGAEVEYRLEFRKVGAVGGENSREELDGGLDGAFGPAELLALERGVGFGDLCGDGDVGDVFKVPTFQLRSVGEVEVLGERVGCPAAGILDGAAPPYSGGAVEVEEQAVGAAGALLDAEMAVDADALGAGEEGGVTVQVIPAGLHEAGFFGGEMGEELSQEIGCGDEIGVEDRDELAVGGGHGVG